MEIVDTTVVQALMSLRGISLHTLSTLAHVSQPDMAAWIYSKGDGADMRVDVDAQLEIQKFLGIYGETPRGDVVHYWRVTETLFSRAESAYQPLAVMLKAFGNARVAFLARESDPALLFKAKACFALQFAGFQAILEVHGHPMRSISFDPEMMHGLEWVPEAMGVLLPDSQYDSLEPGAMRVKHLTQYLTYTTEMAHWNRLRELANEKGIRADQVAQALFHVANPSAPSIGVGPTQTAEVRPPVSLRQVVPPVQRPVPTAVFAEEPREGRVDSPAHAATTTDAGNTAAGKRVHGAPADDLTLFLRPQRQG